MKTRIDYRGRVYIPVEVRRNLRLKPNDELKLECEGKTIILSPSEKEGALQNDILRNVQTL